MFSTFFSLRVLLKYGRTHVDRILEAYGSFCVDNETTAIFSGYIRIYLILEFSSLIWQADTNKDAM